MGSESPPVDEPPLEAFAPLPSAPAAERAGGQHSLPPPANPNPPQDEENDFTNKRQVLKHAQERVCSTRGSRRESPAGARLPVRCRRRSPGSRSSRSCSHITHRRAKEATPRLALIALLASRSMTLPRSPSTRISCPVRRTFVAGPTLTTQGIPYSRATMLPDGGDGDHSPRRRPALDSVRRGSVVSEGELCGKPCVALRARRPCRSLRP